MSIQTYIIARALHVAGVVVWVGGLLSLTCALLPALKYLPETERAELFTRAKRRFSPYLHISIMTVGISGMMLSQYMGLWQRMHERHLWPLHLMLFVWVIFAAAMFILDPIFFRRWAKKCPGKTLCFMQKIHILLVGLSFIAIITGVMVAHGWPF